MSRSFGRPPNLKTVFSPDLPAFAGFAAATGISGRRKRKRGPILKAHAESTTYSMMYKSFSSVRRLHETSIEI